MRLQRKPKKLITLNERLLKDMYYIIPLSGVIFYLNIIQPFMEWKFNIIVSSDSINRVSIINLILQGLYLFLCQSSLEQVKTAYISQLKKQDGPIKILHDFRIDYQTISAIILYFVGFIRFVFFTNDYDTRDFDTALLTTSMIVGLVMYYGIVSKKQEIDRLIRNNQDRFY